MSNLIPSINVIDMYHGNGVKLSDFALLKAGGLFGIIHKVSQGSHYTDPLYLERRKAALDAGLLWGGYHFLDSSHVADQIDHFLNESGISDPGNPTTALACDFENWKAQASLQQCQQFMAGVDSATPPGVHSILYSGNLIRETLKAHVGGFQNPAMAGVEYFFQNHRLWLAEYGPRAKVPWPWSEPIVKSGDQSAQMDAPGVWLWQFTEKGRRAPLAGYTDGNFYDGTFEQLAANWLA